VLEPMPMYSLILLEMKVNHYIYQKKCESYFMILTKNEKKRNKKIKSKKNEKRVRISATFSVLRPKPDFGCFAKLYFYKSILPILYIDLYLSTNKKSRFDKRSKNRGRSKRVELQRSKIWKWRSTEKVEQICIPFDPKNEKKNTKKVTKIFNILGETGKTKLNKSQTHLNKYEKGNIDSSIYTSLGAKMY